MDGFRLERRLARGGMADLFVATTPSGGEPIVVKAIRDDCVGRPEMLRLFEREAALLPLLDHPSIVHVDRVRLDVWNSYIAMELLDGCDLRDLVRVSQATGRRIPLGVCLRIALDVLSGLHYAHELTTPDGTPLGIVHRDVSPSNIMLTLDGRVKLLDFGIAKMQLNTPTSSRVGAKGKGCYMAPEQCQGLSVDPRTDVYATGAVLYELSTSRRAFNGNNEMAVLHSILEGHFVSPGQLTPGFPEALEQVLQMALARHSDDRYQSAAEMAEAIRAAAVASSIEVADRHALEAFICEFSALDAQGELNESLSSLRSQGQRQSFGAPSQLASSDATQADLSFVETEDSPQTPPRFPWRWVAVSGVVSVGLMSLLVYGGERLSAVDRVPLPSVVPARLAPQSPASDAARPATPAPEPVVAPTVEEPPHLSEPKRPAPAPPVRPPKPRPSTADARPPQPPQPAATAGSGLRLDDELRPPKL